MFSLTELLKEEARINDELSRISQIEYPRAVQSQDSKAAHVHLQTIERLKERRTAVQHYLRAYDEGLKALSGYFCKHLFAKLCKKLLS